MSRGWPNPGRASTLRDDVYFHDSGHITADDVLFTFERGNELPARRFAHTPFDIPNCKMIDDYTIDIVSKTPFAPAIAYLSSTGVFTHNRESVVRTTLQEYNRNPVGVTGPYKFSEWIAGDKIILERNEDYWGDKPEFKYLVFRIMSDATARTLAIEANDIDILMAPLSSSIASLEQNPDVEVLVSFGLSTTNILFNNKHPILSDQRVREALLWAIDIPGMSNIAFSGTGEAGSAFVAPIIPGWHAPAADGPWVNQNVDKAKALPAEAGYENGFSINIWSNENQARIDIAEMLNNAWGAIGVTCEVSIVEFGTLIVQMDEGRHDVALNDFVPLPPAWTWTLLTASCTPAPGARTTWATATPRLTDSSNWVASLWIKPRESPHTAILSASIAKKSPAFPCAIRPSSTSFAPPWTDWKTTRRTCRTSIWCTANNQIVT